MRDVVENGGKLYAVGYSSYDTDNHYMQASVFELDNTSNFSNAASWTTKAVSGAESRIGGDYIHSNSVVTDVNKNLVALGSAKRAGSRPENGAAGNRLFVIEDVSASTPTANFLTGGIFFTGAGGKAGQLTAITRLSVKSTQTTPVRMMVNRAVKEGLFIHTVPMAVIQAAWLFLLIRLGC